MKKNILFLCTGNSCRSQMAQGWGQILKGDSFNFYSAGTKKDGLNQNAIKVMQEAGVDISNHKSNTIDEIEQVTIHYVFTVCSDAHESCPSFPAGKVIHVGFDDPPRLTKEMDNEWDLYPNHPYLLNSSFTLNQELIDKGHVVKPIVGRCGSNIKIVDSERIIIKETDGQFSNRDVIYQEFFALQKVKGLNIQIGAFTVSGVYCGAVARVDKSPIVVSGSDLPALRIV